MTEARLRVVRPADRTPDIASGAMVREAAVSEMLVGARKLWVGSVELPAGAVSAPHHHGEAESVIYVVSGHARFLVGERYDEAHDADPGDFVWVPPYVPHVEANRSDSEPVRTIVCRSTQETLVFNLPEAASP
ncbi:MAG: cupin domain-containing protein [Actinomycetota bacterium]|nr:cupin domain-containing protein [Actinomycetota bacterium]